MAALALQPARDFVMQLRSDGAKPERRAGTSKETASIALFILMLFVLAMIAMDIIIVPGARTGLAERYDVVIGTIKSEGLWLAILGLVVIMIVIYVLQNEFRNSVG